MDNRHGLVVNTRRALDARANVVANRRGQDAAVRTTCYGHLAGMLGVAVADALKASSYLRDSDTGWIVTPGGDGCSAGSELKSWRRTSPGGPHLSRLERAPLSSGGSARQCVDRAMLCDGMGSAGAPEPDGAPDRSWPCRIAGGNSA